MAAALALTACLCYGVSNFLGPLLSRENPQFVVLISGQVVAFSVSAAVVLAQGTAAPAGTELAAGLVAGVGNALGVAAFYRAASLGPLSVAAPIGATAAIMPVLIGVADGESLAPDQVAGIVLAVGGVVLAARRESTPLPGGTSSAVRSGPSRRRWVSGCSCRRWPRPPTGERSGRCW